MGALLLPTALPVHRSCAPLWNLFTCVQLDYFDSLCLFFTPFGWRLSPSLIRLPTVCSSPSSVQFVRFAVLCNKVFAPLHTNCFFLKKKLLGQIEFIILGTFSLFFVDKNVSFALFGVFFGGHRLSLESWPGRSQSQCVSRILLVDCRQQAYLN